MDAMEPAHAIYAIPGFSEPVSSMTHLLGGGIALVLGILLVMRAGRSRAHRVALAVFVFGTVNMFAMSGVFHLLSPGGTPRYVLLLLDHAGIWVMIAGTCTPLYVILSRGWARWSMLALVWTLAIVGVVLKTVFFADVPEWLSLTLYITLGWFIGWSIWRLICARPRVLRLFVAGGFAYILGSVLDLLRVPVLIPGVIGPHELFHFAILVAVGCHWTMIAHMARTAEVPEPRPSRPYRETPMAAPAEVLQHPPRLGRR